MTPENLTDSELSDHIATLSCPSYTNPSKFHTRYLADLQAEARRRNLKLPEIKK